MVRKTKQTLVKHMKHAGHARWFRAFVALVFLASTAIPAFMWIDGMKAYAISPEAEKVIGSANKNLSAKFSFDETNNKWQFNKDGAAALAANIARQQGTDDVDGVAGALSQLTAKQVGGAGEKDTSLYSVDLPVKAKEGITYYDNVNKLSFKMVPDFGARDGKLVQDRIVYPFSDGAQVVYTAKANGMKEDIVLSKYIADTLRYSYNLELPDTLEAKLLDDGSIGIYSANVALFGNISFSGDADKARVMEARKTGTKDNLVFNIPPPFIKDQTGNAGHTKYLLNGNRITVVAEQLKNLKYPLTVDPSVTVTSSSDFEAGNNEGMTSVDTDQISRGGVSGANAITWGAVSATSPFTARENSGTTTYNGYVYVVGGNNAANSSLVNYARLTASGTLSANSCGTSVTWCSGPNITYGGENNAIAYNGYLYSISKNKVSDTVEYIQINTNGSLGASWSNANTGAAFPLRYAHAAVAYNGYMYVLGGCGTGNLGQVCPELTNAGNTVYKAEIRANGQLGAWGNANTGASFAQRYNHNAYAYNGYMYVLGGCNTRDTAALTQGNCLGTTNDVSYAKIDSSGNLGAWASTNPFTSARVYARGVVHNGYMYVLSSCDDGNGGCQGGTMINDAQYAPIYANGTLGTWSSTTALAAGRLGQGVVSSGGYIYQIGGCSSAVLNCNSQANYLGDAQSARIDSGGAVSTYVSTNNFDSLGVYNTAAIASNGYLYVMGGERQTFAGVPQMNQVRYAQINANGTVGTWNTATSFVDARVGATLATYGNSLYLVGGLRNSAGTNCTVSVGATFFCPDVQRATINTSTGALTWSGTYTYSANARAFAGVTVVNNYIYVVGGQNSTGAAGVADVNMAQINADGTIPGSFSSTLSLDTGRMMAGVTEWGGRIYVSAGRETRNTEVSTINPTTGAITDWATTGNDVSGGTGGGLDGVVSVSHNGYIYLTGGRGVTGGILNTTQIAKINNDGTLANWSVSSVNLANGRYGHGGASYNGYLYVMGGCGVTGCGGETNVYEDTLFSRINNGGNGLVSGWTNSGMTNLPAASRHHGSVAYNGYLYVMGGQDAGNSWLTSVQYSPITNTGNGAWASTNAYTTLNNDQGVSFLAYNGYMYKIGGTAGVASSIRNDVQYASINSNGSLGAWSYTWSNTSGAAQGGGLVTSRWAHDAVAYNGRLYVSGGCTSHDLLNACLGITNTVETAAINANGTVGNWSTVGTNLPSNRWSHRMVAYNGYIYVIAGCEAVSASNCASRTARVDYARANASGLDSNAGCGTMWCRTVDITSARNDFAAYGYNGYLYVVGGQDSAGNPLSHVQHAPISANGTLNRWNTSDEAFPTARSAFGAGAVYDGKVYILGGCTNTLSCNAGATADVRQAALAVQSRIGRYSKLLAISPTTDVAGVYYNGTLPPGSSVTYRVAPTSGVFGAVASAIQGTGSEPTPLCGLGTIYYVQLMTIIDDSTTAVFPDVNGSAGNVTDLTVYYRLNATPPPNLRMTGGKWFWNEMQRELDTCKQTNS